MLNRPACTLVSFCIHCAVAALLFTVTLHPDKHPVIKPSDHGPITWIAPYQPKVALTKTGGGGGGGDHSTIHASKGDPPKAALRQFVPPVVVRNNEAPKLAMEPTIVADPNVPLPTLHMGVVGDPFALAGPPSNGTGKNGGIGEGDGGGVGPGHGRGLGPGEDYGVGGGPGGMGSRGAVTPASLLWKVEPEYSDEARRARLQGAVVLYLEVDEQGKPRNVKVRQSLGLGLDEKAIEAVLRWKFRPGRMGGKVVSTSALVEVNFRLL